jgi:polygalacturonase
MKQYFILMLFVFSTALKAQDFNILDYGAIDDGKTLNTVSIQKAIDAAHEKGGGRVIIPPGHFLSGSIVMKSNVELHLMEDAFLVGST